MATAQGWLMPRWLHQKRMTDTGMHVPVKLVAHQVHFFALSQVGLLQPHSIVQPTCCQYGPALQVHHRTEL
jgi:hypothetical protein